eukprot:gene18241-28108_t
MKTSTMITLPLAAWFLWDTADYWLPENTWIPVISYFRRSWKQEPASQGRHFKVFRDFLLFVIIAYQFITDVDEMLQTDMESHAKSMDTLLVKSECMSRVTHYSSELQWVVESCGKWVHDNLAMRTHHEKSLKHQENTKELIAKAQSSFSEKKAEEENLAKELARIERQAYNAYLKQAAPAFGEVGFKSAWSKPVFTKVVEAPKDDDSDPEAPATRIIGVNVDPVRDDDPPLALPKRVAHTAPASGEASTTPTPLAVKKRKADENDDEEGGLVIEETLKGDAPAVSFKKRKGAAFRKKPGP